MPARTTRVPVTGTTFISVVEMCRISLILYIQQGQQANSLMCAGHSGTVRVRSAHAILMAGRSAAMLDLPETQHAQRPVASESYAQARHQPVSHLPCFRHLAILKESAPPPPPPPNPATHHTPTSKTTSVGPVHPVLPPIPSTKTHVSTKLTFYQHLLQPTSLLLRNSMVPPLQLQEPYHVTFQIPFKTLLLPKLQSTT